MDDNQKPFACSEKGCDMTFTNEDHLNWHQKKHDMMLNLGLAKNNDVADQTPTPTRFIRNCEEVGLFQDLQNVNPFEEFFKKAVELKKNGVTLEVPEANSDDTLHTPHILPHIEENQKKINSTNQDDNSQSNDFSLNVIPITPTEKACEINNTTKEPKSAPVIVIDDSDDERDIKKKIKAALQNKEKQKITNKTINTSSGSRITVVPIQNLAIAKETACGRIESKKCDKCNDVDEEREKKREQNKAAQIRCRKRKQIRWREMEEEICLLKAENKKLKLENHNLQRQLMQMKEKELSKTNKIAEPLQGTVIGTLVPVSDNQKTSEKGSTNSSIYPQLPKTCNTPVTPNPLVIQILPKTVNLNGQLKSNMENSLDTPEEQKGKRKNFRKIIPKIIIEN